MGGQNYLARHNVNMVQWQSCSPDINPVEHIQDLLGHRARRKMLSVTPSGLTAEEWNSIPNEVIQHCAWLTQSIATALIHKIGGHTQY